MVNGKFFANPVEQKPRQASVATAGRGLRVAFNDHIPETKDCNDVWIPHESVMRDS